MKYTFGLMAILVFSLFPSITYSQTDDLFKPTKQAYVIKSDPIDLDQHNDTIIIPGGRIFRKNFEKIGYFKNPMEYETFIKGVKAANITEDNGDPIKTDGYRKYYKKYKHFIVLELNVEGDVVEFSLLKPDVGKIFVVRNKARVDTIGIFAGKTQIYESTWNSLFNELVNYIRANSKTYSK